MSTNHERPRNNSLEQLRTCDAAGCEEAADERITIEGGRHPVVHWVCPDHEKEALQVIS
jgi:hypothetical protein